MSDSSTNAGLTVANDNFHKPSPAELEEHIASAIKSAHSHGRIAAPGDISLMPTIRALADTYTSEPSQADDRPPT